MFPLKHPLKTPQLPQNPSLAPDPKDLELSDEYIAELLLREARDSAKQAEKYGVMSYLSGRLLPQRKEKPDTQFFQNVMKSTIGGSEFQQRKAELERLRQEDIRQFREKKLKQTVDRAEASKPDNDKKHKKEKKEKKENNLLFVVKR